MNSTRSDSSSPHEILEAALRDATLNLSHSFISNPEVANRVELVSKNLQNRACVRFLLSCLLAKIDRPTVDIRKPYTEIGDADAYSGRNYDERYITAFVTKHDLPCNQTTAYLTPAFRNIDFTLTPDVDLVGRPRQIYRAAIQLLNDVQNGVVTADELLRETIRLLLVIRNERIERMQSLMADLRLSGTDASLSSEQIVLLLQQHLALPHTSRLPVLMVAAAYTVASEYLGERMLPLAAHNAADRQTQALGDIEIALLGDDNVVTAYEMKTRQVTINDIEVAVAKVSKQPYRIDNYIVITTDNITPEVQEYARSLYHETSGIEFVVLDCIGFIRHFLHLFHRLRMQFLDKYQELVLAEPESAVNQPLKEAFLSLRRAAQTDI